MCPSVHCANIQLVRLSNPSRNLWLARRIRPGRVPMGQSVLSGLICAFSSRSHRVWIAGPAVIRGADFWSDSRPLMAGVVLSKTGVHDLLVTSHCSGMAVMDRCKA